MKKTYLKITCCAAALLLGASPAMAQDAATDASSTEGAEGIAEIVVTAQKRSERLTDVPLSVTAVTGDSLAKKGITSAADLERAVPGFTYQPSNYGTPVFAIRGVGFFDTALGVAPAVTVYLDQVPLPFLSMTPGASFDLERVEALKGPQGTLFGMNSTGGAINYIAAKPTSTFQAGARATYGRFNQFDVEGYVSGPLSDTLAARVAVRSEQRDDWQKSYTRDDSLGQRNFLNGRFLLDWQPSDAVKFELNVNGWRDKSDTQAGQFRKFAELIPGARGRPDARNTIGNYPIAPVDIRSADWDAGKSFARNDRFYQVSLRGDADVADFATLTSITAYSRLKAHIPSDLDGTNFNDIQTLIEGDIKSFNQELRLANDGDRLKWVVGGNIQIDRVKDHVTFDSVASNQQLPGPSPILFTGFKVENHQRIDTWAAFAGVDYEIVPTLTLAGSIRYTDQARNFAGCLHDVGGGLAAGFSVITRSTIPPGGCVSVGPDGKAVTLHKDKLDEDSISWRAGVNWKPNPDVLVYANVSRGYKAGSFGTLPALNVLQFKPVPQESLLAYEAGLKLSLLDRRVQISTAAFYYDYTDKQLLGRINTGPLFGVLPGLITVPKSSVRGAELEITAAPIDALRLSFGANYIDSKIDGQFSVPDPYGAALNVDGFQFPNTPKWQIVGDAEFTQPLSDDLNAFIGGAVKYRSSSYSVFTTDDLFKIEGYALLDLRAGIESESGWSAQIWGRNVTNKRYLTHAWKPIDSVVQLTGMPATYGITLGYKFR